MAATFAGTPAETGTTNDKNTVDTKRRFTEQSALLHSTRQDSAGRLPVSSCDDEVEKMGNSKFTYLAALVCGLGNASDAVELLAISFIIPNLDVEASSSAQGSCCAALHCRQTRHRIPQLTISRFAAIMSATVFLGMLIGGLYTGAVSDVIGRKPMLVLSLAVNAGKSAQVGSAS